MRQTGVLERREGRGGNLKIGKFGIDLKFEMRKRDGGKGIKRKGGRIELQKETKRGGQIFKKKKGGKREVYLNVG